jgi:hypothetical protein
MLLLYVPVHAFSQEKVKSLCSVGKFWEGPIDTTRKQAGVQLCSAPGVLVTDHSPHLEKALLHWDPVHSWTLPWTAGTCADTPPPY